MSDVTRLLVALVAHFDTDDDTPTLPALPPFRTPWKTPPPRKPTMSSSKKSTTFAVYPQKITSFRRLQGGQYGTLDVAALSPRAIQLGLGADEVALTIEDWAHLRRAVDTFFFQAHGQPVPPQYSGAPIEEDEGDEEVTVTPVPPTEEPVVVEPAPARRPKRAAGSRGR
jgi:hypothetical protein